MSTISHFSIKASLNDDLRRITLNEVNFEVLKLRLRTVFGLEASTPLKVRYQDEEEDMITISSDEELSFALGSRPEKQTLKIFLTVENKEAKKKEVKEEEKKVTSEKVQEAVINDKLEKWRLKKLHKLEKRAEKENWRQAKKEIKKAHRHHKRDERSSSEDSSSSGEPPKEESKKHKKRFELKSREERLKHKEEKMKAKEERLLAKLEWLKVKEERGKVKREAWGRKENEKRERGWGHERLVARFVKHVTVEDGTVLPPNTSFSKTWRFRNEGTTAWPSGSSLLFVSKLGDQLQAPSSVPLPEAQVLPSQEVEVSVPMVSPALEGTYTGFWRLATPEGRKFGQRVSVQISVQAPSSLTSVPASPLGLGGESDWAPLLEKLNDLGLTIVKKPTA